MSEEETTPEDASVDAPEGVEDTETPEEELDTASEENETSDEE